LLIVLGAALASLALDPDAAGALESLGVSVAPVDPARVTDRGIAFPIVNSPRNALCTGQMEHAGGLELSAEGVPPVQLTGSGSTPSSGSSRRWSAVPGCLSST